MRGEVAAAVDACPGGAGPSTGALAFLGLALAFDSARPPCSSPSAAARSGHDRAHLGIVDQHDAAPSVPTILVNAWTSCPPGRIPRAACPAYSAMDRGRRGGMCSLVCYVLKRSSVASMCVMSKRCHRSRVAWTQPASCLTMAGGAPGSWRIAGQTARTSSRWHRYTRHHPIGYPRVDQRLRPDDASGCHRAGIDHDQGLQGEGARSDAQRRSRPGMFHRGRNETRWYRRTAGCRATTNVSAGDERSSLQPRRCSACRGCARRIRRRP